MLERLATPEVARDLLVCPTPAQDVPETTSYAVVSVQRRRRRTQRPCIQGPADIQRLVGKALATADREHFMVVLLSTKNHVLAVELVSVGSLSASIVHPREVFKPAIVQSAAAVAFVHNHPSGDTTPSPEDIELTRRLARAGELLGIRVLDHVIVGEDYTSLRELGHVPE